MPPARLVEIRAAEARASLRALGLADGDASFLGLPDGGVAAVAADERGADAAESLAALLGAQGTRTVLVPWRRDPHPDHRAVAAIVARALARLGSAAPVCWEYAVWLDRKGAPEDDPRPEEGERVVVDVRSALLAKARAIRAHRSQRGLVVPDDPGGFVLPREMIRRALSGRETFVVSVGPVA